jgi:hypothetical protein
MQLSVSGGTLVGNIYLRFLPNRLASATRASKKMAALKRIMMITERKYSADGAARYRTRREK